MHKIGSNKLIIPKKYVFSCEDDITFIISSRVNDYILQCINFFFRPRFNLFNYYYK